MTRHSIVAEIEIDGAAASLPDPEIAYYPEIDVTFDFTPGYTSRIRHDENDYPGEGAGVEFVAAKLVTPDAFTPSQAQIDAWAENWLIQGGYDLAVEAAREDRE